MNTACFFAPVLMGLLDSRVSVAWVEGAALGFHQVILPPSPPLSPGNLSPRMGSWAPLAPTQGLWES